MEHHHYSNHATQQEQSHEQQPTHIDQYDMTGAFDFLDVVPPQIDQNHALHYDLPMDMHQHLLPDKYVYSRVSTFTFTFTFPCLHLAASMT